MESFYSSNYFSIFNNYSFSLLLFSVLSYIFILTNLFFLFFLFDMKYLKSLNELKFFGNLPLATISVCVLLLSFAGIPPLLGFISKFLTFIYIIAKNNFMIIFFFIFTNMFIIYFYIQNLRFLSSKNINHKFFVKNKFAYFNKQLLFIFNFFFFFNFVAIFFFEEVLIYFNLISSNYYF